MPQRIFLSDINMSQNQLVFARTHSLATAPTNPPPVAGQQYYNTSSNLLFVFNGTSWVDLTPSLGVTDLSLGIITATTVSVESSTGSGVVLPEANTNDAGLLSASKWGEITINSLKVTNATHTGDVSGSGLLTLESEAITGKSTAVPVNTDYFLFSDTNSGGDLKKGLISELVGGYSSSSVWRFDSGTGTSNPGTGDIRFNNTALPSVTQVYINSTTRSGVDASSYIENLRAGDTLYVQQQNDSSRFGVFTLTGTPSTLSGWYNIPVTTEDSGLILQNGKDSHLTIFTGAVTGNVSTSLSTGTVTQTTYGITSDGGTNDIILVEATSSTAGLLGADKWEEIVANSAKVSFPGFSTLLADYGYVTPTMSNYQLLSQKNNVNGYAGLDGSGKIATNQLPALAITTTYVVSNQSEQLALTVQEGDVAVRTDESKSYIALNSDNVNMGDWQELLTPTGAVTAVTGVTNRITSTGGLTPEIDISSSYVGQTSISTLGTITTGSWTGSIIAEAYLQNQSGTNTGDQTTIVGISGTKVQYNSSLTNGNFQFVGDAPTSHTLLSHTISGETSGHVLAANSATTYSIRKLLGSEINNNQGWTGATPQINASTTVKGVSEEATMTEINNKTATGSTGARLFINPATLATSAYARRFEALVGGSTSVAITHNLLNQFVHAQLYVTSTFEKVEAEVVMTSNTVTTFNFNTAPSAGEYTCVIIG